MSQSKIAAKFARAEQTNNGFTDDEFVARTIRERGAEGYFVGRYKARRITDELEDGIEVPSYSLVALEPLFDDDLAAAKALLDKQFEQRTGRRPDGAEQDPLFDVDGDGNRVVPEAGAEELMAERAEAKAAQGGES